MQVTNITMRNLNAQAVRIYDLLVRHSDESPDAEAAVEGSIRLTYSQLIERVDQAAAALLYAGVKQGDRVATLAPPGLHFWITCLAATSVGAIWVGLNPRYRDREYAYLLGDASPNVVFTQSPYEGRHYDAELQALGNSVNLFVTEGEAKGQAISLQEFISTGDSVSKAELKAAQAAVSPEDIAVIVYTSGTTGAPKGAMLSHYAITSLTLRNTLWMGGALRKTVMPAPINHVGGLNNYCMQTLAYGGCIVFHHRISPCELLALYRKEQPTYLVISPTVFIMFLETPGFDLSDLGSFRLICYGGAKTPRKILEPFDSLDCELVASFGQTECCSLVTRTDPDASLEVKSETVGRAVVGVELRVSNPDSNEECVVNQVGELQIKADCLMSGYFNRPEATKEAFTADGYLRTGDLALFRDDGNYQLVGRIKEMFKSGGYNIYPTEIEEAICEHPQVNTAAVLSMPDAKYQEVGCAFVVPKADGVLDANELQDFLRQRIANYKVPKAFHITPHLPLMATTKIDKQALKRNLEKALASAKTQTDALHTAAQSAAAEAAASSGANA